MKNIINLILIHFLLCSITAITITFMFIQQPEKLKELNATDTNHTQMIKYFGGNR